MLWTINSIINQVQVATQAKRNQSSGKFTMRGVCIIYCDAAGIESHVNARRLASFVPVRSTLRVCIGINTAVRPTVVCLYKSTVRLRI